MSFPQIVGALIAAGFDGYLADLRPGQATYYLPDGRGVELSTHVSSVAVAAAFNSDDFLAELDGCAPAHAMAFSITILRE